MKKKVNKTGVVSAINTAIDTTKMAAKKANNFALDATESTVLETLSIASQWQKVQDKALKGGLKLMANQQDLTFSALEMIKGHMMQSKKRFTKLFV